MNQHDRIKNFSSTDGLGNYTQDGLHSGDWLTEIDALTTDGLVHAGTSDDPYVGIVCTVNKLHVFSGEKIALDPSKLQNFTPSSLSQLMYALNNLDIVNDALPYTIKNLLTTTTESGSGGTTTTTGFRLNQFSEDTETLSLGSVSTYTTPTELNGQTASISKLTISSTAAPSSLIATYEDGTSEALSIAPTVASSVYTYDLSSIKAASFTLSDPTTPFTPLSISYDSAVYDLSQSEFLAKRAETPSSVEIVSYSEPIVAGNSADGTSMVLTLAPTVTGSSPSTYTYDLSGLSYEGYTFTGTTSFVSLTYNDVAIALSARTKRWTTSSYNDIDCLATLLSSLYDSSTGKYFSFDDANGLQSYFSSGHSTNGILKFFLDCDYYTKLSYTSSGYDFLSRDVTIYNFFSYQYSDSSNPALAAGVKLGSNIGGVNGVGDLSYTLSTHQKISELEKIFDSESTNGIVSAKWIQTESDWIDENLVDAGLFQSALSNVGVVSYPVMLRVLGLSENVAKMDSLMSSLVPDPSSPTYVSKLGSHILAGQLTTMNYLRWNYLSDSSNFVSPSGATISHDSVFGAGVAADEVVPDLYGPSETTYSMGTTYSFVSLYENGCAVMRAESSLTAAAGALLKDPSTDPMSASDKAAAAAAVTALDGYNVGAGQLYLNLAYLSDLYNGFVLQGYFYNDSIVMTDFPSPLALGYLDSFLGLPASQPFSYLTLAGLIA